MFRYLRIRRQPEKVVPDLGSLSADWLTRSPGVPITLEQINDLPVNAKKRAYRALLPPDLLTQAGINPITWDGAGGDQGVLLIAEPDTGMVAVSVRAAADDPDELLRIELQDTSLNGINLNLLVLNNPNSPRFPTDYDKEGKPTRFGTVRRNLAAEEEAMQAGLAPAQVRRGLNASRLVLRHLESFLVICGHAAYSLEPLTYVSAWVFERRGFAYARGHKLMDDIHKEFQPDGRLHTALDGSTPFRQPDQWRSVRGRAWAIHDGILEVLGTSWNGLRMIKQVGRHAGVETFSGALY
jgi:hypothetical protein